MWVVVVVAVIMVAVEAIPGQQAEVHLSRQES